MSGPIQVFTPIALISLPRVMFGTGAVRLAGALLTTGIAVIVS